MNEYRNPIPKEFAGQTPSTSDGVYIPVPGLYSGDQNWQMAIDAGASIAKEPTTIVILRSAAKSAFSRAGEILLGPRPAYRREPTTLRTDPLEPYPFISDFLPKDGEGMAQMAFNRGNPLDPAFSVDDPVSLINFSLILRDGRAPIGHVLEISDLSEEVIVQKLIPYMHEFIPTIRGFDVASPPIERRIKRLKDKGFPVLDMVLASNTKIFLESDSYKAYRAQEEKREKAKEAPVFIGPSKEELTSAAD